MVTGIVTANGAAVRVGAALLSLPSAKTPAGEWVAQIVADVDAGVLVECPHCHEWGGCECEKWLEYMLLDRRPLDEMTDEDLPV